MEIDFREGKDNNFYVSWKDYADEVKTVGNKLKSEKDLKEIVAIKRGGLIGGVMLSHYLSLPLKVLSIDELLSDKQREVQNFNALLWDDVSDKGNTFLVAKNNLQKFYLNVITASVYIVEGTCFTPNHYNKILPKNYWIVFPWEEI
jgi:hypoxanthine phosphoribosyltransferase